MILKKNYETLSEAITKLKKKGYTSEFDFKKASLIDQEGKKNWKADALKIVEIHRFEGMTNPDDSSILYVIESKNGEKGLLVDAYGMYADTDKTAFMRGVEILSE
jgi:hypothetical protein